MMFKRFFTRYQKRLTEILDSKVISIHDVLKTNPNEINLLNLNDSRKLSLVLFQNYRKNEIFEKFNEVLQGHLTKLFPTMPKFQKSLILKNLGLGIEKNVSFSKPLLESMIKNLGQLLNFDFKSNELISIIKFIPHFKENNIEYESPIISYFSSFPSELIYSLTPENQENLELILTRIGQQNKFFDIKLKNSESIYSVLSKKIEKQLESMTTSEIFSSLRCLIINDRGDEDFIRKIESKLMKNLSNLHEKHLAELSNVYTKRVLFNSEYMIQSVYQPMYEEIVNRFDFFTGKTLSYILFNHWRNSSVHGMFCDDRLKQKLEQKCRNLEFFEYLKSETRSFLMQNIVSYLSHANQLDSQIIESLLKFEEKFRNELQPMFYLRTVMFLMRVGITVPSFAEKFKQNFNLYMKDSENYLILYLVWLNAKYISQEGVRALEEVYTTEVLHQLIEFRKKKTEKFSKYESRIHSEVTKTLDKLKIQHSNEYYDEFYLDVALPNEKICIEIAGPGHYLHPSLQLNGKSMNRKRIIEKLGWNHYFFSYFEYKTTRDSVHDFILKVVPFNKISELD